jgi:hypothetical protein
MRVVSELLGRAKGGGTRRLFSKVYCFLPNYAVISVLSDTYLVIG